jgi:GDPmannose 4,6-dehydratase
MVKKIALIFGITGQDGAYLAKFLLKKNYIVHGVKRRSSSLNTSRVDDIYLDPHQKTDFFMHYGDLTDSLSILNIIKKIKPNEIYNLGAQSHVGVSFEVPEYTANVDAI